MTVPVTDQTIGPAAELLRACFEEALGRPVCVRADDDMWASTSEDECCTGAAWVNVGPVFAGFPAPDENPAGCWPAAWSVVLELGAARCAPTPDAQHIPTCGQQTALMTGLLDDLAAMMCAIACFGRVENTRVQVGTWLRRPTEGRCAGSSLPVTVAIEPCLSCPG